MINFLKSINFFILPNRVNRIKYVATVGFYYSVILCIVLCIMLCTPQFPEMSQFLEMSQFPEMPLVIFIGIFIVVPAAIIIANLFLLRIKRLHDFNCSGWLSLLVLVPIIGGIWDLLTSIIPGTKGGNSFGPAPDKARKVEYIIAWLWISIFIAITLYVIID